MDVGIYLIQAAIYTTNELPVKITAQEVKTYPERFTDIDETITWQMTFPSGTIANCSTSYAVNVHHFDAYCEQGAFGLSNGFGYDGIEGYVGDRKLKLGQIREQALHMDHFARVTEGEEPLKTPGEMGRRDMKIIEAIYRAIAEERPTLLSW